MKTLTKITLLGAALSVMAHLYLAFHYYPIKFGFASGPSICSVNSKFDCDAVAASSYSDFLGVPIAVWGASINLIIFIMVLGQWRQWSEYPERLRRWAFALIGSSLFGSLVMAAISTRMQNYCLVCMSLYVVSIVMFESYRRTLDEPFFEGLREDIPLMWSQSMNILIFLAAIPGLAFAGNMLFLEGYGVTEISHIVDISISDWKMGQHYDLAVSPSITVGPARDQAQMVISEFADFRCHHCKNASPSIDNFVKSHPSVRFEFYNFPLDGECNEKIPESSGFSCQMAYAVQCGEKQGMGLALHHELYARQEEINQKISDHDRVQDIEELVRKFAGSLNMNIGQLTQCMADPQTKDAVRLQAKQGAQANVEGTPTIYVNGRIMPRGQLIPVLEAALNVSVSAH